MSKPKGRKRSNYGVSIYQEAPVVVQRKRKATEISIVENGVRIFGKGNTIGGAPEQAAYEQSASNPLWYNQNNMAPQPQPVDNRPLPSQSIEGQAGYPMRRTRSHQRQMLEGYELRPTASGLSEALMMDGDYMLQHSRSQMSQLSEDASLPFRPTISGLEEVLGREFELPRDTSSLRTTRQLSNSLQFQPAAAAAGTEEESRHAPQRSGQPMRRVRSRGGLDSSLGAGAPLQKSCSGLSGALAAPADDDNMRITRARAHAGSNGSAEGSFHNGLPLMHSVSNMSSILANLIADEAPAAAELAGLQGSFRDGSFRLTRSRTADSSNGMSRSVSGILNNLLAGDAESDNIVSELMAACGSGRATGS